MKLSFNASDIKNGRLGFTLEECLTEEEATKVKNLDLSNIFGLDKQERLNLLMGVISEEKANMVNSHLEKEFIIKKQKEILVDLFEKKEIDSRWRKKIESKIAGIEKALDKKELEDFAKELLYLQYGVGLGIMTREQAEKVLYDEYAEFLQSDTTRFGAIFPITPPTSFFPYHPKYIKEAISILKTHCQKIGDTSKLEAIERVEPLLWYIKDDEECMLKLVQDTKWRDLSLKLIKDFQKNPNQLAYIEKYLEGESFEKIDFDNLNPVTAKKLARIISMFFKNSYLLLNILFGEKAPEALLPFPKAKVIKLIDFMIQLSNTDNKKEETEAYGFMKNYINNEYINDEIALGEFNRNISSEDSRSSLISDLENRQFEKTKKLFSE